MLFDIQSELVEYVDSFEIIDHYLTSLSHLELRTYSSLYLEHRTLRAFTPRPPYLQFVTPRTP